MTVACQTCLRCCRSRLLLACRLTGVEEKGDCDCLAFFSHNQMPRARTRADRPGSTQSRRDAGRCAAATGERDHCPGKQFVAPTRPVAVDEVVARRPTTLPAQQQEQQSKGTMMRVEQKERGTRGGRRGKGRECGREFFDPFSVRPEGGRRRGKCEI